MTASGCPPDDRSRRMVATRCPPADSDGGDIRRRVVHTVGQHRCAGSWPARDQVVEQAGQLDRTMHRRLHHTGCRRPAFAPAGPCRVPGSRDEWSADRFSRSASASSFSKRSPGLSTPSRIAFEDLGDLEVQGTGLESGRGRSAVSWSPWPDRHCLGTDVASAVRSRLHAID